MDHGVETKLFQTLEVRALSATPEGRKHFMQRAGVGRAVNNSFVVKFPRGLGGR